MRLDTLLKAGLGIAKKYILLVLARHTELITEYFLQCSKVEVAFYESRIRVNGEKVSKKSIRVNQDCFFFKF